MVSGWSLGMGEGQYDTTCARIGCGVGVVLEILWHRVTAILTNVMAGAEAMFTSGPIY